MKKMKRSCTVISLLILFAMAFNMVSCIVKDEENVQDLMDDITPREVTALDSLDSDNAVITDFALRLFKASNDDGENTLISPLSVLYALAMAANGAEGETLAQMEDLFGMSVDELNLYLHTYLDSLPQSEKCKLGIANSIWIDDTFGPKQEFLQTNADYYGADIYKLPFDNKAVADINNWVKKETEGMISEIIEKIPDGAVMYLINALVFEAEWQRIYLADNVKEGVFTREDGTEQTVEFMCGIDEEYIEGENATGFVKYYKDSKYAFVALLPNEDISVAEYVQTLDVASLNAMLTNHVSCDALYTMLPKFKSEYSVDMVDTLKSLGMTDAFDEHADFSKIAEGISISAVLHKTYIEVAEKGTKAAAVTAVENYYSGIPTEIKYVYLDRPFVYMIIDCENNIPVFIGTVMEVNQ